MVSTASTELSQAGKISGVFGIKGWLKVQSFTEPADNLFDYQPWLIKGREGWEELKLERVQRHKGGWIVKLEGVDDRNQAELYKLKSIHVSRAHFAELDEGEYYWHQLMGLAVFTQADSADERTRLGTVKALMETGANDVLVVEADADSVDDRERLIPYVPGQFVLEVDLEAGAVLVDWHLDD